MNEPLPLWIPIMILGPIFLVVIGFFWWVSMDLIQTEVNPRLSFLKLKLNAQSLAENTLALLFGILIGLCIIPIGIASLICKKNIYTIIVNRVNKFWNSRTDKRAVRLVQAINEQVA